MSEPKPGPEPASGPASTGPLRRPSLDSALDAVVIIDTEGLVVYFNPSAERTFGASADEVLGRALGDVIVPPPHRAAHRDGLARYVETGKSVILGRRIELMALRKDGTEFPVELTVTKLEPPEEPGFIGFLRDITERVRAEQELRSAHRRAESIAGEQAALRRVATLVARQSTPRELFSIVAKEVAHVLGIENACVVRFDNDRTTTVVGAWGRSLTFEVGVSFLLAETIVAGEIWRTARPVSADLATSSEAVAAALQKNGLRFVAGAPIIVDGEMWGAIVAFQREPEELPDRTPERLERFTELLATAVANANARADLVAAQRRVIEAADAARQRLTRDLHDGAQRQFVTSLINLQRAQQKWSSDPAAARELLDLATVDAEGGVEELRELAAGIHPAILTDLGLSTALEALTARAPIPVALELGDFELPSTLAISAYYCCSEALTNVIKHASARSASVSVKIADGELRIEVRDDGVGGAQFGRGGTGLIGLRDRVGALEGSLFLSSPTGGGGTTLLATIPLGG